MLTSEKNYLQVQWDSEWGRLYGVAVESLPYTAPFDDIYAAFSAKFPDVLDKNELWLVLLGLRKQGLLKKYKKAGGRYSLWD